MRDGAAILDAGCGLGDALVELRREYPQARLSGIERSWPLRLACALRCRFARIGRADMWAADWSACDLVYLFQRPESMQRAADKARREIAAGAWLASLEFEIAALVPERVLAAPLAGAALALSSAVPARRRLIARAASRRPAAHVPAPAEVLLATATAALRGSASPRGSCIVGSFLSPSAATTAAVRARLLISRRTVTHDARTPRRRRDLTQTLLSMVCIGALIIAAFWIMRPFIAARSGRPPSSSSPGR